jgi:endonuclease/exonuclease/phosphatase family metal-dependent hydrolase
VLVRSWNLFHGNTSPPQRRGFLGEMVELATADQPDVLCVQEVPGWALGRFRVGDLSSRPPLGVLLGRAITSVHHGLIRGAVAGQGLGIWLAPTTALLDHNVFVLNPRSVRRREAGVLGLDARARWHWAKERRIAQVVRLSMGGRTYVVANLHCTGLPGDTRVADIELMRAAEFATSLAGRGDVVVLAGDFNLRPERSQALGRLTDVAWGFSSVGRGIDHVLVRGAVVSGLEVWPADRRRRSDGTLLSDHAPVELRVDPGQ